MADIHWALTGWIHVLAYPNPATTNQTGMHGYYDSLFLMRKLTEMHQWHSRDPSLGLLLQISILAWELLISLNSSQPPLQSEASEMQVAMRTKWEASKVLSEECRPHSKPWNAMLLPAPPLPSPPPPPPFFHIFHWLGGNFFLFLSLSAPMNLMI